VLPQAVFEADGASHVKGGVGTFQYVHPWHGHSVTSIRTSALSSSTGLVSITPGSAAATRPAVLPHPARAGWSR
jgi:hypothetical protein